MTVNIFVYTKADHTPVWDSERAIEGAVDITWDSTFYQGYGIATFKVRRKDVFDRWDVQVGMTVIIRDDGRDLFDGRIDAMPKSLSGSDEFVTITCVGWFIRFSETPIRHRWVDKNPHELFYVDLSRITVAVQQDGYIDRKDGYMRIQLATADVTRTAGDYVGVAYDQPGSPIHTGKTKRITATIDYRTGEGFNFNIWNVDTSLTEYSAAILNASPSTTTLDHSFSTNAAQWQFHVQAGVTDIYDNNDYVVLRDLVIYGAYQTGHPQLGSEAYNQAELIKDLILMIANDDSSLSTDFSQITDSDLPVVLSPYGINRPTPIADVINEILSYGDDLTDETFRVQVWGRDKSSDSKPQVYVQQWDTSDWEYEIKLSDNNIVSVSLEAAAGDLVNSLIIEFTDSVQEYTRYAYYEDATSIATDYRRGGVLTVGKGVSGGDIDALGNRFLAYHKDRKTRGSVTIRGNIRRKGGDFVPVIWVKGGERFKLIDTGEVFMINRASVDAENLEATLTPDIDGDDNISRFLANIRRQEKENYSRRRVSRVEGVRQR